MTTKKQLTTKEVFRVLKEVADRVELKVTEDVPVPMYGGGLTWIPPEADHYVVGKGPRHGLATQSEVDALEADLKLLLNHLGLEVKDQIEIHHDDGRQCKYPRRVVKKQRLIVTGKQPLIE